MQLLPRYIGAVKQYLPAAQQDDIVAELSDSIQSQMEDKETAVGRPLTLDEQSAIIKPFGPPLLAASRYVTPPSLVGAALLPYYWTALKILLVVAYAFDIIWVFVTSLLGAPPQLGVLWGMVWGTLTSSVGIVTVVFGVMEFFQRRSHFVERWDPKKLPPFKDPYTVPRVSSIFELMINGLFVLFLLNLPNGLRGLLSFTFFGPAAAGLMVPFTLAPWWHILVPALLVASFAIIVTDCINLVRPEWGRLRAGVLVATNVMLLIVVGFIIPQRPYVVPAHGASHSPTSTAAVLVLNELALIGFVICAVILLGSAIFNLMKAIRRQSGAKP